jgi:hypothetical protein
MKSKSLNKFLKLGVPVLLLVTGLIILLGRMGESSTKKQEKNHSLSEYVPENKDGIDTISDKLRFIEENNKEEILKMMEDENYSGAGLEELLKSQKNMNEGEDKELNQKEKWERYYDSIRREDSLKQLKINNRGKNNIYQGQKRTYQKAPQKTKVVEKVVYKEKKPEKEYSSISIKTGGGEEYGKVITNDDNKYYKAVTETDLIVREHGQMLFILQEDLYYPPLDKVFRKYSTLYGYSQMNQYHADIFINRIKATDNKLYDVSLIGYNSNYQKGIRYDGKYDKAMKETIKDALSETGDLVSGNVELGEDAIENTKQQAFKDISFGVHKGLIMNFKIMEE